MFKASKGDLFSFLSITGEENQDQGDGDGDGDGVGQTEDVAIDDGVSAPLLCKSTSTERTQYLQSLVPGRDDNSKIFRAAVKLVDTLEVSCVKYLTFAISYSILG